MHRVSNVLDALLSDIVERIGESFTNAVADCAGDPDPARLRQCLQPRCDIDVVAEDILGFDNNVAKIDPNSEADALVLGGNGISIHHSVLDFDGTAHCVYRAWELRQQAITGVLDDAAAMLLDLDWDGSARENVS